MYGGKRDIVTLVHLVGIRIERDLTEVFAERRIGIEAGEIVDGGNVLVDISKVVFVLAAIAEVCAIYHLTHKPVDGRFKRAFNQIFYHSAEIFELALHSRIDGQLFAVEHRVVQRKAVLSGVFLHRLHSAPAYATFGHIDYSCKRLGIVWVGYKTQVGKDILYLFALKKLQTAEHFIRYIVFGELLLERARKRVHPHKYGKIGISVFARRHKPGYRARGKERL